MYRINSSQYSQIRVFVSSLVTEQTNGSLTIKDSVIATKSVESKSITTFNLSPSVLISLENKNLPTVELSDTIKTASPYPTEKSVEHFNSIIARFQDLTLPLLNGNIKDQIIKSLITRALHKTNLILSTTQHETEKFRVTPKIKHKLAMPSIRGLYLTVEKPEVEAALEIISNKAKSKELTELKEKATQLAKPVLSIYIYITACSNYRFNLNDLSRTQERIHSFPVSTLASTVKKQFLLPCILSTQDNMIFLIADKNILQENKTIIINKKQDFKRENVDHSLHPDKDREHKKPSTKTKTTKTKTTKTKTTKTKTQATKAPMQIKHPKRITRKK
jgi:hypothetical protein